MPIVIFREKNLGEFEKIDQLCHTTWNLADQLFQLETWMDHKGKSFKKEIIMQTWGFQLSQRSKEVALY